MIYLASDHAGFALKKEIKSFLEENTIDFEDIGPHEYHAEDDYPDFIIPAAQKVGEKPNENLAIVIGGSGQGESIAANKVRGVRAALYYGGPKEIVSLSKTHNNANVLSLGARFVSGKEVIGVVKLWLETKFTDDGKHARRIEKIGKYEGGLDRND
jgi:ribose 5-phosphate isomerase B